MGQTEWAASTLSQIGAADHDMMLLPGDLSYADRQQVLWDSWGRLVQRLASARPWMVTEGNHEKETLREHETVQRFVAYNARWRMPHEESGSRSNLYYSFDASGGAVHVVMLGSYADLEEGWSEQHAWLRRDLAAVDRRRTPWLLECWCSCTCRGTTPTGRTRARRRPCARTWRACSMRHAWMSSSPVTPMPMSAL